MNCEINTHIARYLKKQRQSEDKIWLVNRYNMRINFLENLFKKSGGETSPKPFFKQSKLSISESTLKFHSLFLLYDQVEVSQNILKLRC